MAIFIPILFAVMLVLGAPLASAPAMAEAGRTSAGEILVRYEPTPYNVVDGMLKLAQVGPRDFVVDLGDGFAQRAQSRIGQADDGADRHVHLWGRIAMEISVPAGRVNLSRMFLFCSN